MLKKVISVALAAALCVSAGVAGTLAYLTDRDSEANVFTVGDVSIDLKEDFTQGTTLLPGTDATKDVIVENTGKNDAWVWVEIAIPSALDNPDASKNVLHFNFAKESVGNGYWSWGDNYPYDVKEINSAYYNVYTVKYQTALKPGEETTYSAMTKVYLDTKLDITPEGDWYIVNAGQATPVRWNSTTNGAPIMYVSAYGIQAEGFADVEAAYAAYQAQWGENGGEYAEPPTVVTVSTMDELEEAIKAGATVIDAQGNNLGDFDYDVVFPEDTVVKNAKFTYFYGGGAKGTVTFDNCEFVSDHSYSCHFDNGGGKLIFDNCLFDGWNSFGTAIANVEMNDCTFQKSYNYGLLRFYQTAQVNGCTFADSFEGVDTNVTGCKVEIDNCTGISDKVYNNGSNVGIWFIDGVDVSDTVTSW